MTIHIFFKAKVEANIRKLRAQNEITGKKVFRRNAGKEAGATGVAGESTRSQVRENTTVSIHYTSRSTIAESMQSATRTPTPPMNVHQARWSMLMPKELQEVAQEHEEAEEDFDGDDELVEEE